MSYILVTPCRNEADYMTLTLDSVVSQTVQPDLWLIVDDGSTGETPAILQDVPAGKTICGHAGRVID